MALRPEHKTPPSFTRRQYTKVGEEATGEEAVVVGRLQLG